MPSKIKNNSKDIDKELNKLNKFIIIYCQGKHNTTKALCNECNDLFNYATERRNLCPFDPKPSCKDCHIHCYKDEYREKIRQVMRYSGKRFYKLLGLD